MRPARFAAVDVVFARYRSVSEQVPTVERVLPIDPSILPAVKCPSAFDRYLSDPQLVAGLVGQFAYISLYHAAAESYASEQASRLVAMDRRDPQHRPNGRRTDRSGAPRTATRDHPPDARAVREPVRR